MLQVTLQNAPQAAEMDPLLSTPSLLNLSLVKPREPSSSPHTRRRWKHPQVHLRHSCLFPKSFEMHLELATSDLHFMTVWNRGLSRGFLLRESLISLIEATTGPAFEIQNSEPHPRLPLIRSVSCCHTPLLGLFQTQTHIQQKKYSGGARPSRTPHLRRGLSPPTPTLNVGLLPAPLWVI